MTHLFLFFTSLKPIRMCGRQFRQILGLALKLSIVCFIFFPTISFSFLLHTSQYNRWHFDWGLATLTVGSPLFFSSPRSGPFRTIWDVGIRDKKDKRPIISSNEWHSIRRHKKTCLHCCLCNFRLNLFPSVVVQKFVASRHKLCSSKRKLLCFGHSISRLAFHHFTEGSSVQ